MSDGPIPPDAGELTFLVATSESERQLGRDIRQKVFVQEQDLSPEDEIDGKDEIATQHLALLEALPIGTARSRYLGNHEEKIGRVAVIKEFRGFGWGLIFMQKILNRLAGRGLQAVTIHAQATVVPFYRRLNFAIVGPEFLEAGIAHQKMTIQVNPKSMPSPSA